MKPKPDVSDFAQPPRDPAAFLDGADESRPAAQPPTAIAGERKTVLIEVAQPEPTVQKLFRMPWVVANALKSAAARESAEAGRRVTEAEIVTRLIRQAYSDR